MGASVVLVPLVPITFMPVEVTKFPLALTVNVPSWVTYCVLGDGIFHDEESIAVDG